MYLMISAIFICNVRNIIHAATRDSAVSSLPEDSTDGFRELDRSYIKLIYKTFLTFQPFYISSFYIYFLINHFLYKQDRKA